MCLGLNFFPNVWLFGAATNTSSHISSKLLIQTGWTTNTSFYIVRNHSKCWVSQNSFKRKWNTFTFGKKLATFFQSFCMLKLCSNYVSIARYWPHLTPQILYPKCLNLCYGWHWWRVLYLWGDVQKRCALKWEWGTPPTSSLGLPYSISPLYMIDIGLWGYLVLEGLEDFSCGHIAWNTQIKHIHTRVL